MLTLDIIDRLNRQLLSFKHNSPILSKLKQVYRVPKFLELMKWYYEYSEGEQGEDEVINPQDVADFIKFPDGFDQGGDLFLALWNLQDNYIALLEQIILHARSHFLQGETERHTAIHSSARSGWVYLRGP